MEQAIKKAIEGGYNAWNSPNVVVYEESDTHYSENWVSIGSFDVHRMELLLDPLFWQALGKQQGWWERVGKFGINLDMMVTTEDNSQYGWLHYWHRFIDHIAEGGDIDEFFNKLIK